MRVFRNRIGMLMAALWCSLTPFSPAASLDDIKASYERQLTAIDAKYAPEAVMAEYAAALGKYAAAAQKAGDVAFFVALQGEQKRIKTDPTIPETASAATEPRLVQLQTMYGAKLNGAGQERDRAVLALTDKYTQYLLAESGVRMKSGDTTGAKELYAEVQRVKASNPVTQAEFGVALSSPTSPATVSQPPDEPEAAAPTTVKATKRVRANGGMSSAWTLTAMRVDKGDKVSITASGRWECPNVTAPCGPAGYERTNYYGYWWYAPSVQFIESNYGALMCRTGKSGTVRCVGDSLTFTAETSGLLEFCCNVRDDNSLRKKCSGEMTVKIEVERAATH